MMSEDIVQAAWSISAQHLARGQRDPTKMVAEAILLERLRCLEIVNAVCGEQSDGARKIRDPAS